MKISHSQILFQASIVILIVFISPSLGSATKLERWLNGAGLVDIQANVDRYEAYIIGNPAEYIEVYKQTGVIMAAKVPEISRKMLIIQNKNSITKLDVDHGIQSTANFLPYSNNTATILHLDHSLAPWFATYPLKDCDVWVALDNLEHAKLPLVIHTNAQRVSDPVEKLQHKEDLAIQALDNYNNNYRAHYKFQLRIISYDYAGIHRKNKQREVNDYLNTVRESGIEFYIYVSQNRAFFHGIYNPIQYAWNFNLKRILDGRLLYSSMCDQVTSTCSASK